jgi:outer membrane murein-binding lipoprotein Lpp
MKNMIISAVCALSLISCGGCMMLAAGAGGTAGVRELTDKVVTYQGDVKALENAVEKMMKDMGATRKETVREEGDAGKLTIRARTFDDEHLTIDMEPSTPSTTMVEIRVGRIGSKVRAEEFHAKLQKYAKPVK